MADDDSSPSRGPVQIGRSMPHSIEAEEYLISCCLLDGPDVISRCMEARIRRESFYVDAHGVIFERLLDLYNRQVPIDVGVLAEDLKTAKLLDQVGGYPFLTQVSGRIPTTAQAGYYIEKVRELALLREIIRSATGAVESCYDFSGGIDEFVDQVEQKIFAVTQNRVSESAKPMREPTREAMNVITKMMMKKGELTGVSSGFKDLDVLTWGFQRQEMIILAARPSMGKCLSAASEIVQADGSIATIEELFHRKAAKLLTLGSDLRFAETEPSDYIDDGKKPVFRVTTRLGRTVEATGPHPFLTVDGWTPLMSLSVGTNVAVPREIPIFGTQVRSEAEIKLSGHLLGDATAIEASTESNQAGLRLVRGRFANAVRDLIVARRSPSNRLAVAAGVFGASGFHQSQTEETPIRAVPAFVFQLPRSQAALFLNRLFSGRGWASLSPTLPGRVGFIAGSQVIARQASHLLSRFGIISAIRPHIPGRVRRDRGEYSVVISERASVLTFAEEIGIFGLEHQMQELVLALAEKAQTNHPFPNQQKAGQLYWDEIVSIEPLGKKQVYDLTIPGTHNFVANDICVHNTSLALNFAEAAAMPRKGDGVGVLLFSLEMSASQLALRMLCSRARVNMKLLRDGLLSKNGDEQNRLLECADEFSKAPLFIDDSSSLSIMQLRAKARRLHARHKLGFIIVDYLQLLAPTDGKMPREQQVAEASRGLKALSKELDLPVLVLSQLNRASEKENRTPKLADLRESGSIEQDADIVLMLARPKDADEKFQVAADSAELIVAKQRNGPVGDLKLTFLRDITRFENYTQ